MFTRYKRSLIHLCQTVKVIQNDPLSERNTCLLLQLQLLKKILYVEKKISQHRDVLKQQKSFFKSKKTLLLSKSDAQQFQASISEQNNIIDEYQHVLSTFKTIGDALAYIYLDKWDIKPQAFKQSPGFLSGKSGLKWELKVFKLVFSMGGIALLNDLTNCLRYGDISIVRNKQSVMIEVKSGHKHNARIRRQVAALKNMRNYLNSGKSDKKHSYLGEETKRLEIHSPEINHIDELKRIIKSALTCQTGYCLEQVEEGLYYGVTNQNSNNLITALTKITGYRNSNRFIVSYVNELKYTGIGYYPFSLSIYDPKEWYAFSSGELFIIVLANLGVIEKKLQSHGLSVNFDAGKPFPLEITPKEANNIGKYLVGRHFLGRLFSEFISLDWFLDEIICQFNTDTNAIN